ncbi:hypothetical protein D9758_017227 [Tetrapyrgos nigripes]|uniref:DUF6535 domain-containing protein n=1 Tax=Tetrapyrgos nigripes TaxID=182062 RepID=A0A8H5C0M6_9AGAR|nr:hypothetical protein D9758_017227 [Tetrapyrgos nigripes]
MAYGWKQERKGEGFTNDTADSNATGELKSDLSQSVAASTASVPVKPGSFVHNAGEKNETPAALPQSTGHSVRSNSMASQHSSNVQDARTDSKVRNINVMGKKSKSEPTANNNTEDEAAPSVLGKPNSQDTNKELEGGKSPDNTIVQILEGIDALLSSLQETNMGSENAKPSNPTCQLDTEKKQGNLCQLLGTRDYNYTHKYQADKFGKEARENARVWKFYLDEAETFDDEMLKGFRDTLDALLVFVALFSAVVTSFVISTVVNLQPDYAKITASLMLEQNQLLCAARSTTTLQSVPQASVNLDNTDVSTKDLWINGLFFASLSLSLATALLSVLVKQWLQVNNFSLPTGNAQERVKIHQFHYLGFEKWRVPEIIGLLPIILHASLGLFMVGLSVYVSGLHQSLCWIVVSVTGISFLMYFGSIIIPVIHIQCPYRVPILFALLHLLMFPLSIFQYFWKLVTYHGQNNYHDSWSSHLSNLAPPEWPSAPNMSLRHTETMFLHLIPLTWEDNYQLSSSSTRHHTMLAYCLKWLQSLQSNDSIQEGGMKDFPALNCYVDLNWNSIQAFIWGTLRKRDETDNHKVCSSLYSLWRKAKEISHFPPQEPEYALYDAAENGYFHIVKVLVENGADVNAKGGHYGFALQAAGGEGHLDIVKYLVEKGADVNAEGGTYGFALQAAAPWGHLDIVKYLVEKGADVNTEGGRYGSALKAAQIVHRPEVVKYLQEHGATQ